MSRRFSRISATALKSNPALVRHYLWPLFPSLLFSSIAALILGMVSTLVATLIGPALQMINASAEQVFTMPALFGPRLGGFIADSTKISAVTSGEMFAHLPFILMSLAGFKAMLSLAQWFAWERAGESVSKDARQDLIALYLELDTAKRRHDEARAHEAELSSTITTDIRLLREYLVHFYGGLPREVAQILFSGIALVFLSPKLFAIVLLGVVPTAAVAARLGKVIRKRAANALQDYSTLTEWLQQRLLGIETIKHYQTEAIENHKMAGLTTGLYEGFLRAARVKARTPPIIEAISISCLVVVLVVALRDIERGVTTGAIQLSFFSTLVVMSGSMGKLSRYLNSNREGAAAVDRIRRMFLFLERSKSRAAGYESRVINSLATGRHEGIANEIRCFDLSICYPRQELPALAHFSYRFMGGRIYCICGPSGAGKSTLMNLLLGLLPADQGNLQLFCAATSAETPIAYMPQKVQLVPATVAANVAYPDTEFDRQKVSAALARVDLKNVVASLSKGMDTEVGEGGTGLSGGQAQRILLARLHYHQRPFVLVDEGTSALDPEVEALVYTLLRELAGRGAVVITIAHRLAGAQAADEVLLLDKGQLRRAGAPSEVLQSEEYQRVLGSMALA